MLLQIAVAVFTISLATLGLAAGEPSPTTRPIVILKLDDVGTGGGEPISARWQRTADFIAKEGVKANFGVIGAFLEGDSPAFFKWIKDQQASGVIEFWNHGYRARKNSQEPDEFTGTLQEQTDSLKKTQRLAKEKLGITFRAFGVHWSKYNESTPEALAASPEIQIWFSEVGARAHDGQIPLVRSHLEQPTFVPNPEYVEKLLAKQTTPYLVLQGHPNAWDDKRFADFVTIVHALKERGCTFMTISEYLASIGK